MVKLTPALNPPAPSLSSAHRRCSTSLLLLVSTLLLVDNVGAEVPPQQRDQQQQQDEQNQDSSCIATDDNTCQSPLAKETKTRTLSEKSNLDECGVWLAPSSIPGAGLGMYAGRAFAPQEQLQPSGEITIPMVDINQHQFRRDPYFLLWDEYTWNGANLMSDHEGQIEVKVASPGFGSAANSFIDLINVEELRPENTIPNNLHRRNDPGAGAFSTYHNRQSIATTDIAAGEEFFVDYGQSWFRDRAQLGPIPLLGDLDRATNLFRRFRSISKNNHNTTTDPNQFDGIMDELWTTFIENTEFNMSRILGAFHNTVDEWKFLHQGMSLKEIRIQEGLRTPDWLREHGVCGDNLQEGISTIKQAGRGGFATRRLMQDSIVAALPLIHVSDQAIFELYEFENGDIRSKKIVKTGEDDDDDNEDASRMGEQLQVNYCLGHSSSTMLLCPYGPLTSLINHNQTQANVKLQWSDAAKGNHEPSLLEKPIEHFARDKTAKLSMDLVAIRTIEPGEELFLDYGDEFEDAWQEHVDDWEPLDDADDYVSAYELTISPARLRTEFEQMEQPYPGNVNLLCDAAFFQIIDWPLFQKTGTVNITDYHGSSWQTCEVLRFRELKGDSGSATGPSDSIRYTAAYTIVDDGDDNNKESQKHEKLVDAPRAAFRFSDRSYTSDMFLSNAFRHPMMIPDDMFPEYWQNL